MKGAGFFMPKFMRARYLITAPTNQKPSAVFNEKYCKGGKENGPNGQTQGALTGRHHFVMALVSQASRLDITSAPLRVFDP